MAVRGAFTILRRSDLIGDLRNLVVMEEGTIKESIYLISSSTNIMPLCHYCPLEIKKMSLFRFNRILISLCAFAILKQYTKGAQPFQQLGQTLDSDFTLFSVTLNICHTRYKGIELNYLMIYIFIVIE